MIFLTPSGWRVVLDNYTFEVRTSACIEIATGISNAKKIRCANLDCALSVNALALELMDLSEGIVNQMIDPSYMLIKDKDLNAQFEQKPVVEVVVPQGVITVPVLREAFKYIKLKKVNHLVLSPQAYAGLKSSIPPGNYLVAPPPLNPASNCMGAIWGAELLVGDIPFDLGYVVSDDLIVLLTEGPLSYL